MVVPLVLTLVLPAAWRRAALPRRVSIRWGWMLPTRQLAAAALASVDRPPGQIALPAASPAPPSRPARQFAWTDRAPIGHALAVIGGHVKEEEFDFRPARSRRQPHQKQRIAAALPRMRRELGIDEACAVKDRVA